MIQRRSPSRLSLVGGLLLAAFATACTEAPPVAPEVPDGLAAKGGIPGPPSSDGGGDDGGGDGGDTEESGDPTVEDTDPASAPQDTTLDVRVFGTNFDSGSKADFLLDGQSTKTVKSNSTTFVSDTELVANITIAADAEPELYDVQVTTSKGRKGVGIELFEIVGPTTDLETATAESGPGLYGDGRGFYIGEFNTNTKSSSSTGNASYNTRPQCDEGRSMDLRLPTDADGNPVWPLAGPYSDCQGDGARSQFHIPDLLFADCPQGSWCPIGTDGHDVDGSGFSADLNYFFVVDSDNDGFERLSARSDDQPHNVVWTDGLFRVTRWGSDGTPCRWEITAGTADLWNHDTQVQPGGQPMLLRAVVHRVDGPCGF